MRKVIIGGVVAALAGGAGALYANYDSWFTFREHRIFIKNKLRDPESAQFRNEHVGNNGILCGEINFRNGSGGYAGFARFISIGPENVRLEGHEPLMETSTQELIDTLSLESDLMASYVELRKRMPEIPVPSQRDFKNRARDAYFEKLWSESCRT